MSAVRMRVRRWMAAGLAATCAVGVSWSQPGTVVRTAAIYQPPGVYCAWPSIARAANGDLLVAFTATEEHLAPDGRILLLRSTDEGRTWGGPDTLLDTPIDERESGFTRDDDGRLVVHCWATRHTPAFYRGLPRDAYRSDALGRWAAAVDAPAYRACSDLHGAWQRTTTDNGRTWSAPVRSRDAVHGGLRRPDGALLIASYREDHPLIGVYLAGKDDTGYVRIATIASPQPDSFAFGEPHIALLPSGRIIMMIRATAMPYNDRDPRCVLWETYSDDGGATWVKPFATTLWGFPPHLLVFSDGRVLCSYGYRRVPFGERACISTDGITWDPSNETVLSDGAPNGDLGYPASVELRDGSILTVYYQPPVPAGTIQEMVPPDPARTKPAIMGTVWRPALAAGR